MLRKQLICARPRATTLLLITFLALAIVSCSREEPEDILSDRADLVSFVLTKAENPSLSFDLQGFRNRNMATSHLVLRRSLSGICCNIPVAGAATPTPCSPRPLPASRLTKEYGTFWTPPRPSRAPSLSIAIWVSGFDRTNAAVSLSHRRTPHRARYHTTRHAHPDAHPFCNLSPVRPGLEKRPPVLPRRRLPLR